MTSTCMFYITNVSFRLRCVIVQVSVDRSSLVPSCKPNRLGIDHCCFPTGTACTSDTVCCDTDKCLDIFGAGEIVDKKCTGNCKPTGDQCTDDLQCCGGGKVRSQADGS